MSASTYGWLILAFPLAGSILIALSWKVLPARTAGWLGVGAIGLAFLSAVGAAAELLSMPAEERLVPDSLYDYAGATGIPFDLGILVDPLSIFMALVVSGVSTMIHVYSVGYMTSDEGYHRYFAYLNFFVFSMLLLVLAGNFVLLVVGWAFVGYASYALVSFWYRRTTATKAGMKAFVINVIGDIGLVFAAILIIQQLGASEYLTVFEEAPGVFESDEWTIVAICLLLTLGAIAKSAQLPLHTWLPDAMEGPTPVSSLIHAATMVTAGVYLIARAHPLFELAPTAANIAAGIGAVTLFVAATIAIAVKDLKRIIAYSTMSQVGYMIMGVSIGAYSAGLFHLMTHAFFKALLFMAAGSVISAMANMQNVDKMGGFRRALPFTFVLMTIGALALAAFPGTSGFWSKDEILGFAIERGGWYWACAIAGYVAAFITAFYSFRIIFRVFYGPKCEEAKELEGGHLHHGPPLNPHTFEEEDTDVGFPGKVHHIAERSWPMAVGMAVLGFGALFAGYIQVPGVTHVITSWLEPTFENSALFHIEVPVKNAYIGYAVGGALSIVGILLAYYLYIVAPGTTDRIRARFRHLYELFVNKWYFDELQDAVIYRPVVAFGRFANNVFERYVVQGLVAFVREGTGGLGDTVKAAQSGFIRSYALFVIAGFVALGLYFLITAS
ncbi:MAG TPA: NADH-quinone oxidoreductase subunit L [Solirubrobacterales bacterium]|nr:NADH-quinone oxidoreductase subunit L [Solirubrobacterales bacterium]